MRSRGIRFCRKSQQNAAEPLENLGSGGRKPNCSLVFGTTGMGAWGLIGSGGKWSRFSSNAVEQKGALRFCS